MSASDADRRPARESAPEVDRYYLELWKRSGFALHPPEMRRWRWMLRALARYRPGPEPARVLDYGCGSGRFLPLLTALDLGAVVGFDVTSSVLEEVARRQPGAEIVVGDGSYPSPLPDTSFRLVIASEVIEHLVDQETFVADLARILAPGGLLLLTTPNARFEARYKAGTRGLQPIERWLDRSGLESLLTSAGFGILESSSLSAHWANMPYQRSPIYRLAKRIGRRLGAWAPIDALEHQLAGRLGRGITLMVAARRPE